MNALINVEFEVTQEVISSSEIISFWQEHLQTLDEKEFIVDDSEYLDRMLALKEDDNSWTA